MSPSNGAFAGYKSEAALTKQIGSSDSWTLVLARADQIVTLIELEVWRRRVLDA